MSSTLMEFALTAGEESQFRRDGYVAVRNAFSAEIADEVRNEVLRTLVVEQNAVLDDPGTPRLTVSRRANPVFAKMNTARLLAAIDAVAGPGLWDKSHLDTHGNFWVTFPGFHGRRWEPPMGVGRWHIDLGFDSRTEYDLSDGNCALVTAILITNSNAGGGATVALKGSHRLVGRLLAMAERAVPRWQITAFCESYLSRWSLAEQVVELTGAKGDVVLMHPLLVHSASANTGTEIRIMTNTGVGQIRPRHLNGGPGQSLIEECLSAAIADIKPSAGRTALVRGMLWLNWIMWKCRYFVHGRLPKFIEAPLPVWRLVPERALRAVCAAVAHTIARTVR